MGSDAMTGAWERIEETEYPIEYDATVAAEEDRAGYGSLVGIRVVRRRNVVRIYRVKEPDQ